MNDLRPRDDPTDRVDDAELRRTLKALRVAKSECSRAFGQAKRDGLPLAPLKARMSEIQGRIREAEARLARHNATVENPPVIEQPTAGVRAWRRPAWPQANAPTNLAIGPYAGSDADWDAYVATHPAARVYHTSASARAVESAFALKPIRLAARRDNQLVGVLQLVRQRSHLFGDFITALPFFNYGGALGDHPDVEGELMRAAGHLGTDWGVRHVEFRDDCPREGWPARTDKLSMLLELPASTGQLMASFPAKLRAQIRRPERENPQIAIGGAELLDDFYKVFAVNMRDLGTPVYAREFFEHLLHNWGDMARIVTVAIQGTPVACALVVGYGPMLEIPWASTLRSANHLSINMLLYWAVLRHAITTGYRTFDFGRTTAGSATHRFKAQWGASALPLYWHYWLPTGAPLPGINPDNPRYALLIRTWQQLPVWLANRLGPKIVRHIP